MPNVSFRFSEYMLLHVTYLPTYLLNQYLCSAQYDVEDWRPINQGHLAG